MSNSGKRKDHSGVSGPAQGFQKPELKKNSRKEPGASAGVSPADPAPTGDPAVNGKPSQNQGAVPRDEDDPRGDPSHKDVPRSDPPRKDIPRSDPPNKDIPRTDSPPQGDPAGKPEEYSDSGRSDAEGDPQEGPQDPSDGDPQDPHTSDNDDGEGNVSDNDAEFHPGLGLHKHDLKSHVQGTEDWQDNVGFSAEDQELLLKKQRQEIINEKISKYVWGQDVKDIFSFPDLQKARPLKGKQRAELMKGLPDLSTSCPCPGLKGMGDEEVNLSSPDRWFCDTAAPQLHRNIMEEMSVIAWILQEATNPDDVEGAPGTRVGLTEEGIFTLLKKLVTLKMDTLSLIASMQITRVRSALGRVPKEKKENEKTKPIISAEMMEEDDKLEEKKVQKSRQRRLFGFASARRGGAGRGRGGSRRHRQASRFSSRPSSQNDTYSGFGGFSYNQRQNFPPRATGNQRPSTFTQTPARKPFQSSTSRARGAQRGRPSSTRGRPKPY